MPSRNIVKTYVAGGYYHIYNRGIDKRIIFEDEIDYKTFLKYLKEALSPPMDVKDLRVSFSFKGGAFKGLPRPVKNFVNDINLIAYCLMPNHFHLLVSQSGEMDINRFMQSITTRYSMYFNKKYNHTGALFEGPYKSVHIKDEPSMLHLTRCLHHFKRFSSFAEFLGTKVTSWVNPNVVLSYFGKGASAYKDYVEKYRFDQEEKVFFGKTPFEDRTQLFEDEDLASNEQMPISPDLKPRSRKLKFLTVTTILFMVLFGLGIRNVVVSAPKKLNLPAQTPAVLSKTAENEKVLPPKIIVIVTTTDKSKGINIRQKPTTGSKIVGIAKDGDTFEYVSFGSGWYGIKLADNSIGFISATYITPSTQ